MGSSPSKELLAAARHGNLTKMQRALDKGAEVNTTVIKIYYNSVSIIET
jgi:hypothetical protein